MTQCNLKDMESMTEEEYLAQYKLSDYERPSVTVDMLIFTITRNQRLAMILIKSCLLYTSPSPRDGLLSRMPSSA